MRNRFVSFENGESLEIDVIDDQIPKVIPLLALETPFGVKFMN